MSSKSFFPLHTKCFLRTFTKYLAVITAQFKRRREYSHNLLSKESSSCKNQLNTALNMLPKAEEKTSTNKWRMFTFHIGQCMCAPSLVFPFAASTLNLLLQKFLKRFLILFSFNKISCTGYLWKDLFILQY